MTFSPAITAELTAAGLDPSDIHRLVSTALAEDLRYGPDATTTATVPADAVAIAELTPRAAGVIAGIPVALAVFDQVTDCRVLDRVDDGTRLQPGQPALTIRGPVRGLLTAERTALNLLCHLSGVATTAAAWVAEIAGTGCAIRDSRKTLPGLRLAPKYSITAALAAVRAHAPELPCEVEVDTLAELDEALALEAEEILLDNFTPATCAEAVRRRDAAGTKTRLEASGGLTLNRARAYAETGVDYLSVGGLTHSVTALDLGMDLR